MKLQVSIDGVPDFASAVKYVKNAVAGALEEVCQNGALPIKNEAKLLCPVKTGTLRRSINHQTTERTPTKANVAVGPNTPYARRVEFGFVGTDSLDRRYNQAPQPYMRPAFDSKQEQSRQEMVKSAKDLIDEAVIEAYNQSAARRRR